MARERTRPDDHRDAPICGSWEEPGEGGSPWAPGLPDTESGRSRWPWRSTLLVTVVVLVGSRFAAQDQHWREPLDGYAVALLACACVLLLWRWHRPVLVAFGTSAVALGYLSAGYPYGPILFTVALGCFGAVVAGHRRAALAAVGGLWVGHLLVSFWLYAYLPPPGDGRASWQSEIGVAAWVLAVVAVSELVRVRREQQAKERAERAAAARRRADEERLRIARELHDVLAHSISVINVQAGVGLALLDSDPEQARAALSTIKTASKEALGEVRQVLDTLRAPGAAPRTPAPGLARLPELVDQAASAGLTVTVETVPDAGAGPGAGASGPTAAHDRGPGEAPRAEGDTGRAAAAPVGKLPPGLDLAAFRIVQEALTNVVRHSGARQARVQVRREGRELRLQIDDDGPATGADAGGSGKGLAGMRERAAALGGTIEAGPRPDGGFRVLAVLPLDHSTEDR